MLAKSPKFALHQVRIESNALDPTLVFHELRIDELALPADDPERR